MLLPRIGIIGTTHLRTMRGLILRADGLRSGHVDKEAGRPLGHGAHTQACMDFIQILLRAPLPTLRT
jgi:hypothetical protein